jgi:hypothetical protein
MKLCEGLAQIPLVRALGIHVGNTRHIAARAETTGNGLTSRRAFDLQQRYRLR